MSCSTCVGLSVNILYHRTPPAGVDHGFFMLGWMMQRVDQVLLIGPYEFRKCGWHRLV
jgi:hypothetical protein